MKPKRKSPRGGKKSRSRKPSPVAELPLQQGLLEMATVGAQSVLWLVTVVAIFAGLAAAALGIWSLRPIPAYSSERVTAGSAFAATFHVENMSAWFPLSHLKIRCAPSTFEPPDMVEAERARLPDPLQPGQ